MVREVALQQAYLAGETIGTIYFGGGTPSLLSTTHIEKLIQAVKEYFSISETPEITLEANPDDLTEKKLDDLYQHGINRLSIGIQSFDNAVLKFLHRAHTATAATDCMSMARASGFKNISIDLIYAIPDQHDELWRKNINQAINLHPEHVSAYALTIEPKTVFGKWAANGKLSLTDDDRAAVQLDMLVDRLADNGYEQYEVSNFSKPGFQSQHNSSYWKQEKYVGIGPSAHSYNGTSRQFNISNNYQYLRSLQENKVPFTQEILTRADKINDYLLTTLRTSWGTDLKKIHVDFDYDMLNKHASYIENLLTNKLGIIENDTLVLNRKGKLLADKIASDLFVDVL